MWWRFIDSEWFFVLYFFLLAGSVASGYFIARRYYVRRNKAWSPSGIESSLIGFFALVLSFTLSASYNSSKDRNALIHAQGDAIAQLHREALFLPPSLQSDVRAYLNRHVDALLAYYRNESPSPDSLVHFVTLQNETFMRNASGDSARIIDFRKIQPAFTSLSAATFKLLYSFEERTPTIVVLLLLFSSLLIGLLAGFMNGFHKRLHLLVPLLYVVLTFCTLKAVLDLDNPLSGNVRPKYQNLMDLKSVLLS